MPITAHPRAALLSLAAALALLAGLAPAAGALPAETLPPGLTLSVQDDHFPVVAEARIGDRIDQLASTGVTVTRVNVLWNDVAPSRPRDGADPNSTAYRWSRYDAVVDGLAARGIAVILNVYRSPPWANGGRGHQWAPNLTDYGAFMSALARRYDGTTPDRAGRTHAVVEMFEAWNEPNLPRFLMPQWRTVPGGPAVPASPRIYAGLLSRAFAAVKAVQPDAWVIGVSGGPNGSNNPPNGSVGVVTFIRGLVPFHPPADAFATHLYPAAGPVASMAMPSFTRLPELIAELDAVRDGLPLLITEFGWTTMATSVRASHVTEAEQEAFLSQAVDALAAVPRVRLAVWFNLQDNSEWTAGLRRIDSAPKPSWETFTALPKFRGVPVPEPPVPAPAGSPAVPAPATAVAVAPPPAPLAGPAPVASASLSARRRCARLSAAVRTSTGAMRAARRARAGAVSPAARRAASARLRALTARRAGYLAARARSCR